MAGKERSTEVHAYVFIKETLKQLGWDTRNPFRNTAGRVWTQNECLEHDEIRAALKADRPENIVKVNETLLWVIEAKKEQKQLAQAIKEAEEYAREINKQPNVKAAFISGVAGNDATGYLMQTRYLVGNTYKPVTFNTKEISSLIAPDVALAILADGPDIKDVPVDEKLFLTKAEKINQHLHLGAINKNYRARVMAALLLSLLEDTPPNVNAAPSVLISEINARAERVLKTQGKSDFFKYIQIALPPTEDNHIKFKTALVRTIQELNILNIRSAMNSGTDVLGKFYEVFLKYGNGAKEIGIVLTPRHVTAFAVDVVGVTDRDVVLDLTCGTGGFLVAAFDHVKKSSKGASLNRFKTENLLGIDQEAEVVALAIVNMIFRGDGKNKITEGNCLQINVLPTSKGTAQLDRRERKPGEELLVTRVLMNPPFALKASEEKEFRFVEHALEQMQDGSILFSVLPYPAMVKPGKYKRWRIDSLLRKNTLLSVMTFPPDLFYPVSVYTVGIFVKKGEPHPHGQNVLWVRAINDGHLKRKGKRLPNDRAENDFPKAKDVIKAFLPNPALVLRSVKRFMKACPVDFDDPLLELVPENYLDDTEPQQEEIGRGMEKVLRDTAAYLVTEGGRK